ncbi:MAG: hypothetical protein WC271_16195 [Bacteroidales bacterium]|jgi:hypothetical protein|nr:hypothetical protein [Bacteroidales bacterium]NCB44454.1 hypothetical protein [Clostridia bacterium]
MRQLIYALVLFIISCGNTKNSNEQAANNCTKDQKIQLLINEVINLPILQQYYNVQEVIGQKQLVIVKTGSLNNSIKLNKFELPVKIIPIEEIQNLKIEAYLEFEEIVLNGDSARVYFRYDIQGIGCTAEFTLSDCKWEVEKIDLWEN